MKGYSREPSYTLVSAKLADVRHLFESHHGYKSTGNACTYCFAVIEDERAVAAFLWQPPPPAAARSVCPALPHGVLALSRMVAVPHEQRRLRHLRGPLRAQMRRLIDRTRWPVLVTYSDEGQGHTGYVYRVSGWTPKEKRRAATFTDAQGRRVSSYSNGVSRTPEGATRGETVIRRWEHWICDDVVAHFASHWRRVAIPGKVWRSGAQAYTYERVAA